jgi:pilus assembly protein Flp/PilA
VRAEFRIMKVLIARFACDESGATAVEYGLIAAAMSAAIITMMLGLGSKLTATFASVPVGLK